MKLYIGKDVLEPKHYTTKSGKDHWYISINGRETLYDAKNRWLTFETEQGAEMYLSGITKLRHILKSTVDLLQER